MSDSVDKLLDQATILIDQGNYTQAEKLVKDYLHADPNNPFALYLLATCQWHTDKKTNLALDTINQAIAIESEESRFFELKALILSEKKKFKEALQTIDEALSLNSLSTHALACQAYIFVQMEKWPQAEEAALKSLTIDAQNVFAGNMLAVALQRQNRLDENQHLVSTLLSRDPDNALTHTSAGWNYLQKRDYDKAHMHFKEALRIDPNFEAARQGMLESFKSRSPIYRLYLRYVLFMARQSQTMRIVIILGIFFGFKFVRYFVTNLGAPFKALGMIVIALFYLFFFFSWISSGLGNLIILQDPLARLALKREEVLDGIFVGGFFFVGLILLFTGILVPVLESLSILGVTMIVCAIPFSMVFTNDDDMGQKVYLGVGCVLGLIGLTVFAAEFTSIISQSVAQSLIGIGLALFILTTWLGAFNFLKK